MKIQIYTKSVYGNTLIYPACEKAKTFAALTGKKTLSEGDMQKIVNLGFEVERVFEPSKTVLTAVKSWAK